MFGSRDDRLATAHRQRIDFAVADQRQCRQQGTEIKVDAAGDHFLQPLGRSLERHAERLEARGASEALRGELRRAAQTDRDIAQAVGLLLGGGDQILEAF